MTRLIGLAIGVVAGGVQFWLLSRFTSRITGAAGLSPETVFLGVLQFLLPLAALVAVGFIRKSDLLPAALGIIGAILVGAVVKYVIIARKSRGHGDNDV